ncbi:MAG TPA: hypothetical protein ACQGQI_06285, partial [Xylella sp.]
YQHQGRIKGQVRPATVPQAADCTTSSSPPFFVWNTPEADDYSDAVSHRARLDPRAHVASCICKNRNTNVNAFLEEGVNAVC